MAITIKNIETEQLARALARASGESLTAAITTALRDRLESVQGVMDDADDRYRRAREISHRSRARWPKDQPHVEYCSLLYDDRGLPR